MVRLGAMKALLNNQNIQNSKAIQLTPGQIFQGKVLKLFPNHMAQVQLGGTKVHARLETALSAQSKYWFEVQPNKEMLALKVIQHPAYSKADKSVDPSSAQQLLTDLGVSNSKNNQQLLGELIQKQIPFAKESLLTATNLMKEEGNHPKVMSAIQTMLEKGLPMTKEVLKSLVALQENKSMAEQLKMVKNNLIPHEKENPNIRQLTNVIQTILGNEKTPAVQDVVLSLIQKLVKGEGTGEEANLLRKLSLLPQRQSRNEISQILRNQMRSIDNLSLISNIEDGKKLDMNQQQLFSSIEQIKDGKTRTTVIENVIKSMNKELNVERLLLSVREILSSPTVKTSINGVEYTAKQVQILHSIQEELTTLQKPLSMESNLNKELPQFLKDTFSLLGLQFEHSLAKSQQEQLRDLQTLKPMLLNALGQENLSQPIKEELQQLLLRVTGQQLMSSDPNGPLQQLVMQIPLQLGKHHTDLTLQWQGKRKEDGQIDSDFCRILFYLDLEAIKETVIDVQVQNRIINIEIINDTPGFHALAAPLQTQLKENLLSNDYKLSSLQIRKSTDIRKQQLQPKLHQNQSYTGVDFRV